MKSGPADKKSKSTMVKKRGHPEDDDEVADVKPKKAKKAAAAKAEANSEADEKPKKKSKKPSAKKESFSEGEEGEMPTAKRSRAKKTAGTAENGSDNEAVALATATEGKGKGKKTTSGKAARAVKQELQESKSGPVSAKKIKDKSAPKKATASVKGGDQLTTPKKRGGKRTVNPVPSPELESNEGPETKEEVEENPKTGRGRGRPKKS